MAVQIASNNTRLARKSNNSLSNSGFMQNFDLDWTKYVEFIDASNFKNINEDYVQQILKELDQLKGQIKLNVPIGKPYVLKIVQAPAQLDILRKKSLIVPKTVLFTPEFKYFAMLMLLTLLLSEDSVGTPGIGLSAIQVGVPWQIFWAYLDKLNKWELVINPIWEAHNNMQVTEKEGCLSLPGVEIAVPRVKAIKAKYINMFGAKNKVILKDLDARVFQHEFDHLQGKLIIDYK